MKQSKNRKLARKERHLECVKIKKERKKKELANKEKYETWLNLPEDQWSDARKQYK